MKELAGIYPESSAQQNATEKWHMPRLPKIRIPRFDLHTPTSALRW